MHRLLVAAAVAACTTGLVGLPNVARAGSDPATVATATPVQHLVVVFQENASFDHYFGTYPQAANGDGEPVFIPRPGTPVVNNLLPSPFNGNVDLRTTNPNQRRPFRLSRAQFVTCSQSHSYRPEERAANLGRMDRFVQATDNSSCDGLPRPVPSPQVMGYFDGNTVTALWNYAQHFALNDNSFGTTYGPSTPGALNLVAGRTSGAGPDLPNLVQNGTVFGDADPLGDQCSDRPTAQTSLAGPNVGDLLSQAGVSWGWFQVGFRRTNALDAPQAECASAHPNLIGRWSLDYEAHHEPFQFFASTANPGHLPPTSVDSIGHDDRAHHQYDLSDFWTAADAGHLPAVSFLKAPAFQDGHPGPASSNPLDEQDFLVRTLNRLQQLPEWSSTAVVLAWDDSDGQYDHQFPPNVHHSGNVALDTLYGTGDPASPTKLMCMAPPGQPAPTAVFDLRCGYGERLPLLVISPFARDNYVDHTLTDQTSVLRFIEDNWGLPRLGNASFDEEAGSLLPMFDFGHPRDDRLILNPVTGNPNTPPAIDEIGITPAQPATDAVLTATVSGHDADCDAVSGRGCDPVAYAFQWFNGTDALDAHSDHLDLSVPGNGDRGDSITVRVTAGDGLDTTVSTASVVVADTAPTVRLDSASVSVDYSDALTPIAVTTADPDGDPVTVDAVGLPDGIGVARDDTGSYVVTGVADAPAGVYDAEIRATDGALTTVTPLRVTVLREGATIGYTGDLLFSTGSPSRSFAPVALRAHVTPADDGRPGDVTRAMVVFDLFASGNLTGTPDASLRGTPGPDGDVTVDVPSLPTGTWTVAVHTDPVAGDYQASASDAVPLTVYSPTPGRFLTGGGWVHDPGYLDRPVPVSGQDDHGSLELTMRVTKDGAPSGRASYEFRGADGNAYDVSSSGSQGGGLAMMGNHAVVAGRCVVTVVDPHGGVVSRSGGYMFRVDATDARDGARDSFALSVFTPEGSLYHRSGTPTEPLVLAGGNLVVHR